MRVKRAGLASLPERHLRRARVDECCQRRTAQSLLTGRVDDAPVCVSDGASCMSLASRRDEAGVGVGGSWAAARNVRVDKGQAWRISRAVARAIVWC
jgi:hypothetical protein